MKDKNYSEVLIDGKIYTLAGSEEELYLQKVAAYINDKLSQLKRQPGFTKQSTEYRAVMLELNLTDDYFKAKSQLEDMQILHTAIEKENYSLKHELISTQMKLEESLRQCAVQSEKLRVKDEEELKVKQEAELKTKQEAELKTKLEAELRVRLEAELEARLEAELKDKQEAESKAKQEAESKTKQEAELKAKQEAELKGKQEAESKAKQEAELKDKQEAEPDTIQDEKSDGKKKKQ